jgi:hypothetical protein
VNRQPTPQSDVRAVADGWASEPVDVPGLLDEADAIIAREPFDPVALLDADDDTFTAALHGMLSDLTGGVR